MDDSVGDDDDDYMSDKFLQNDHKPGLMPKVFLNKYKRLEDAKTKGCQVKTKAFKVHEAEKREEKLSIALDSTNKGFAMLTKMGFKSGMGLGKQEQGRSEPIPLEIKEGRKGLGKESQDKMLKKRRLQAHIIISKKKKEMEEHLRGDYKHRMKSKHSGRQIENDLYKSQKACHQLDLRKDLGPQHSWSWPAIKTASNEGEEEEEKEEEDIEEDDLTIDVKLDMLTRYLREVHFYCVWCGVEYQDTADLEASCPGSTYDAHEEE